MSLIDWAIIVGYILFALGLGIYFSKRAGKNIDEFFISGRNLPWWLAGTSMVATTFAVDTPLAVTELVVGDGIAGNWFWWNAVLSGMLATFLFSRLWRRSEIITDVEFTELRYSGPSASFLRGFRALYIGLPINCITMGWVILAMQKIVVLTFDLQDDATTKILVVLGCLLIAGIYCTLSGFWGVVITDIVQFGMAMIGSITLAIIAVSKIGGIGALKEKLTGTYGADHTILNFTPDFSAGKMAIITFGVYLGMQWWASNGVDGTGYTAQRMFAAKNERHSLLATLWFNIAHYTLRPWPWILVALVAMVVYPGIGDPGHTNPELQDPAAGYPLLMLDYLPVGLLGLMLTAFLAAFMSTIDTHLNWGASYLVNDFYKRFFKPEASPGHYVAISRLFVILIMLIAGVTSLFMNSIAGAWKFLIALNAGIGLVQILRWYWWRINAWSEISAMVAALIVSIVVSVHPATKDDFALRMLIIVPSSTYIWLFVTFLTNPVSKEKLIAFYQRVYPGVKGWKPIVKLIKEDPINVDTKLTQTNEFTSDTPALLNWINGVIFVYSTLFAFGKLLLGFTGTGLIFLLIAIISGAIMYYNLPRKERNNN
ncbi:sodium:proline symporter [Candidatus Poribacteria bacterium]|nr:MAG: sodium:proline symporter [Candidatus Poribacteria bacterium]